MVWLFKISSYFRRIVDKSSPWGLGLDLVHRSRVCGMGQKLTFFYGWSSSFRRRWWKRCQLFEATADRSQSSSGWWACITLGPPGPRTSNSLRSGAAYSCSLRFKPDAKPFDEARAIAQLKGRIADRMLELDPKSASFFREHRDYSGFNSYKEPNRIPFSHAVAEACRFESIGCPHFVYLSRHV